jgi:DNA repair protein RecO (recombination protein O)
MQWLDDAIILTVRPHGETSAIAEVLAREQGRYLGLVHGGRSRKKRPMLQPGNRVQARWRARLPEQLGTFDMELLAAYASRGFEDRAALAAIMTLAFLVRRLPERDPHPVLFDALAGLLAQLGEPGVWPSAYVQFELLLLQEFGFGLDLSECAATGETENLIYVSPKSGRAVSAGAGAPYADKLLPLPAFVRGGTPAATSAELADGLRLTGAFIERHVLESSGGRLPETRAEMIAALMRPAAAAR